MYRLLNYKYFSSNLFHDIGLSNKYPCASSQPISFKISYSFSFSTALGDNGNIIIFTNIYNRL